MKTKWIIKNKGVTEESHYDDCRYYNSTEPFGQRLCLKSEANRFDTKDEAEAAAKAGRAEDPGLYGKLKVVRLGPKPEPATPAPAPAPAHATVKGPTELVIDRSRWARNGAGKGDSRLLNSEGNMCCLGFYCKAAGIDDTELLNKGYPAAVRHTGKVPSWLLKSDGTVSGAALGAVAANDGWPGSAIKTDAEREAFIEGLFLANGCKVTFVGEREVAA